MMCNTSQHPMPVTVSLSDLCRSHLAITLNKTSPDGTLLHDMTPVSGLAAPGANQECLKGVYVNFSLVQGDQGLVLSVFPSTATTTSQVNMTVGNYQAGTYEQNPYPTTLSQNPSTVYDTAPGTFDYALAQSIQQTFAPGMNIPLDIDVPCILPPLSADHFSQTTMHKNMNANENNYSSISFEKLLSPSLSTDDYDATHSQYPLQHDSRNDILAQNEISQWQTVVPGSRMSPISSSATSSSPSPLLSASSSNPTVFSDELIHFDSLNYYECPSPESSLGSGTAISSPPSPIPSVANATFSSFPSSGAKSGVHTSKTMPRQARRRRFQCLHPSCTRLFTSEYTRRVHMATHNIQPRKALPCTMRDETGCTEMFSRAHDRLRHEVAMHGKECEWVCNVCGRFFSTSRMLEIHKCPGTISGWIKARCPRILGDIAS